MRLQLWSHGSPGKPSPRPPAPQPPSPAHKRSTAKAFMRSRLSLDSAAWSSLQMGGPPNTSQAHTLSTCAGQRFKPAAPHAAHMPVNKSVQPQCIGPAGLLPSSSHVADHRGTCQARLCEAGIVQNGGCSTGLHKFKPAVGGHSEGAIDGDDV